MDRFTSSQGISEIDALPLEYKRKNRQPKRQVDVSYFIGKTALNRFLGLQKFHLQEQCPNIVNRQIAVSGNDL